MKQIKIWSVLKKKIFNREKKQKFFDWHLYPNEPIELWSFVEILIFITIVGICGFFYWHWNSVPQRDIEVCVENLGSEYTYDKKAGLIVDSCRSELMCFITHQIPMTTIDSLIDTSYNERIMFREIIFNKDSFWTRKSTNYLKKLEITKSKNEVNLKTREAHTGVNDSDLNDFRNAFDTNRDFLDSLRNILIEIDNNNKYKSRAYIKSKQNIPNKIFQIFSPDKVINKTDTFGIQLGKTWCDNFAWREMLEAGDYVEYGTSNLTQKGLSLSSPSLFRLEDISQAYINIKIKSTTIDSIVYKIDFVGATQFSKMEPEPDIVDMSYIIFNDPQKIMKIKLDGLHFYAKFQELENIQEIRVFTVTAIMSAFVFAFVVFIISAFFKMRRRYKRNKPSVSSE